MGGVGVTNRSEGRKSRKLFGLACDGRLDEVIKVGAEMYTSLVESFWSKVPEQELWGKFWKRVGELLQERLVQSLECLKSVR